MMRRREFIAGLGGAAIWPLGLDAQSPAIRRIGYVWIGARGTEVNAAGLSQGLIDQGYLIGRDVAIEDRYADGYAERISALIGELLALKVDLLATPGTPICPRGPARDFDSSDRMRHRQPDRIWSRGQPIATEGQYHGLGAG
jgi:hypothetical protein